MAVRAATSADGGNGVSGANAPNDGNTSGATRFHTGGKTIRWNFRARGCGIIAPNHS
jgi:hypothetical protein